MTYTPIIANQVEPWFNDFGTTLTDATSFRHMIKIVNDELEAVEAAFAGVADGPILRELKADRERAEALIAKMEDRLSTIVSEYSK